MTRDEVLQVARAVVTERGWDRAWLEPIIVLPRRKFIFFGRRLWEVTRDSLGMNFSVWIEDATGRVVRTGFIPR